MKRLRRKPVNLSNQVLDTHYPADPELADVLETVGTAAFYRAQAKAAREYRVKLAKERRNGNGSGK